MKNWAALGTIALCGVLAAAAGCESVVADTCSTVPDGTYVDGAGQAYAFVGGQPAPGWDCGETPSGCQGSISCSPHGETVYTVAFVHLEDGSIRATTSPPGDVVTLTRAP